MITTREGGAGFLELYAGLAASAIGSMPSIGECWSSGLYATHLYVVSTRTCFVYPFQCVFITNTISSFSSSIRLVRTTGIYYGVYSYGKRVMIPYLQEKYGSKGNRNNELGDNNNKTPLMSDNALKLIAIALSAGMGNTVASAFRVPYEVVKQKLQTGQYTGTVNAITKMFKADGMRAFFPMGGVYVQMIRDVPYAIFTLLAYEMLRDVYVTQAERTSPWRDMVAGATAGGFGTFMTNGLDVIKTRLQTDPDVYGGSVLRCTRMTIEEGGAAVFMRGIVPRLMHKIPANGMFFVFLEAFRRLLKVEGAHDTKGTVQKERR